MMKNLLCYYFEKDDEEEIDLIDKSMEMWMFVEQNVNDEDKYLVIDSHYRINYEYWEIFVEIKEKMLR
jgi:hypothetical protein